MRKSKRRRTFFLFWARLAPKPHQYRTRKVRDLISNGPTHDNSLVKYQSITLEMVHITTHPSEVQDRIPHEHPALARCATVISLSVCQPACLTVLRRPLLLWDPLAAPAAKEGRTDRGRRRREGTGPGWWLAQCNPSARRYPCPNIYD